MTSRSPDAVRASAVRAGFVAWSEIDEILLVDYQGQVAVGFMLRDPEAVLSQQRNPIRRKAMEANQSLVGTPMLVPAVALKMAPDEVARRLRAIRARAVGDGSEGRDLRFVTGDELRATARSDRGGSTGAPATGEGVDRKESRFASWARALRPPAWVRRWRARPVAPLPVLLLAALVAFGMLVGAALRIASGSRVLMLVGTAVVLVLAEPLLRRAWAGIRPSRRWTRRPSSIQLDTYSLRGGTCNLLFCLAWCVAWGCAAIAGGGLGFETEGWTALLAVVAGAPAAFEADFRLGMLAVRREWLPPPDS